MWRQCLQAQACLGDTKLGQKRQWSLQARLPGPCRPGLCTDSAVRHRQHRWISPVLYVPGVSFPQTHPLTHSAATGNSIYANAWLTLLMIFSLCSHYNSSLGRAVKCLKPGHWCSSHLPSATTTAYDLTCSQKPSVSISVQDSTTLGYMAPVFHTGQKGNLPSPKRAQ